MKKRAPVKRTAVARPKRDPDTQHVQAFEDVVVIPGTVFVLMGHRAGSHGVVGLYRTRVGAETEKTVLETKGNKHARSYTFTIDERVIHP